MLSTDLLLLKQRLSLTNDEGDIFLRIIKQTLSNNQEKKEAARKADLLESFSKEMPIVLDEHELIVGSSLFRKAGSKIRTIDTPVPYYYGNMGHGTVDYGMVLTLGIPGIRQKIQDLPDDNENKEIFRKTIDAFSHFIGRYAQAAQELASDENEMARVAENCRALQHEVPATFWQALQMICFMQVFLHAEGMGAAVGIGRVDVYLYPYYERELQGGLLTREEAETLLSCLFIKMCEGGESQNIALGGDQENDLSLLCLEISEKLHLRQPSVSVRIGKATTEEFWDRAIRLVKSGQGQPAFFNDEVVIRSLMRVGIKKEDAENYCITGCYEANPSGKGLGLTVAYGYSLHPFLLDFLAKNQEYASFEEMYQAFKTFFVDEYTMRYVPNMTEGWGRIQILYSSPFESICLNGCLDSGKLGLEKGSKYTMFGITALGLGTIVDSLYVIDKIVFQEKRLSLSEFVAQVQANFPDRELATICKKMPGKYGTDNAQTNEMAHDLSTLFATTMIENRFDKDVLIYPGLYGFRWDIYSQNIPATPDGRLDGERLSYGISASDYCDGKSATSVLNSASNVANDLCANGTPICVFVTPEILKTETGQKNLQALVKGYFSRGGFHLNFNVTRTEDLREAQKHPEQYGDLLIRVSGFSTYFVGLDKITQDALISRSESWNG